MQNGKSISEVMNEFKMNEKKIDEVGISISKLSAEASKLVDKLTVFVDDVEDFQVKGKDKNFNTNNTKQALSNINKLSSIIFKIRDLSLK